MTLEYGLAFSNETTTIHESDRVLLHRVTLQGLVPGRVYELKIKAENELGQYAESAHFYILTKINDEIIIDNIDPGCSLYGYWNTGNTAIGRYGDDYRWASTSPSGTLHAEWTGQVTETGPYRVFVWWSQGGNRSPEARYSVWHDGNEYPTVVNQQINGGQWNLLGTHDLDAGDTISVQLSNDAPSGYVVIADAVKLDRAYIPVSSIGMARLVPDGNRIKMSNVAVTAVFGPEFYVEEMDRSAGLKVAGTGVSPRELVDISGDLSALTGERVILNPVVSKLVGTVNLCPLKILHKDVDRAATTSALLVTVTGGMTSSDAGYFYLDDGSGLKDGTGNVGLRVDGSCLSEPPDNPSHAVVTGILGATVLDGKVVPILRPRDSNDILLY